MLRGAFQPMAEAGPVATAAPMDVRDGAMMQEESINSLESSQQSVEVRTDFAETWVF